MALGPVCWRLCWVGNDFEKPEIVAMGLGDPCSLAVHSMHRNSIQERGQGTGAVGWCR
eukprot:COSAG02_NODE_3704_length_6359_cov_13.349361_5_plen_58_part_00